MRIASSIIKRCSECQFRIRKGRLYMICSSNKKHKSRQG